MTLSCHFFSCSFSASRVGFMHVCVHSCMCRLTLPCMVCGRQESTRVVFLNYSLANCLKHCLSLDQELNDWLVSSWHLSVSRETTRASPTPASVWVLGSELRFSGLFSGYQQVLGLLQPPSPSVPAVANTNQELMSRGFPVTQSFYHDIFHKEL